MSARKRKSFFRENLSLKLVSLILAILLEVYFYSPDNSLRVTLPATIEIRGIPAGLTIVRPQRGERGIPARIELRGPRPLIEQAKSASHTFFVDYPTDAPMIFSAMMDRRQLWLPAGVEVMDLSPSTLTIELERVVKKNVPIVVERYGQVPEGYKLEALKVTPEKVIVSGPEREVKELQVLGTDRIDLTSITAPQRMQLPLLRPGAVTVEGDGLVHVELEISAIPGEKTLSAVSVQVVAPQGFAATVEPSRVRLQLIGPKAILEKLQEQDIELVANAAELLEGRHEVKPEAKLPAGVSVVTANPAAVTVNLIRPTS